MKLKKRFLALGLTAIMALGMAVPAFAADTDPNLTKSPDTEYTYRVGSGRDNPVTLKVGAADENWVFTGFSTAAEAAKVEWNVQYGEGLMDVGTATVEPYVLEGQTVYVSQIIVKPQADKTKYGPFDIRATWKDQSMDFVVNVDPYNARAAVKNVTVDVASGDSTIATRPAFTAKQTGVKVVDSGSYKEFNPLHNTVAAQQYATAAGALVELLNGNTTVTTSNYTKYIADMNVQSNGTYFAGVTGYVRNERVVDKTVWDAAGWDGWQYRVYRNDGTGTLKVLPETATINAAGFALQDNDVVVWRYGGLGTLTFPDVYPFS